VNRDYFVQLLITGFKQNKRNNKKKSRQISSYLKRQVITRIKPYQNVLVLFTFRLSNSKLVHAKLNDSFDFSKS